uniref:Uncharacterized protein n=1 Tax=Rhizophagus irregularis (strain DAOM 181602 / DAOM 197198 / MUCL 43194) TaxID=747089 RepID=U9U5K4_RHIID
MCMNKYSWTTAALSQKIHHNKFNLTYTVELIFDEIDKAKKIVFWITSTFPHFLNNILIKHPPTWSADVSSVPIHENSYFGQKSIKISLHKLFYKFLCLKLKFPCFYLKYVDWQKDSSTEGLKAGRFLENSKYEISRRAFLN